MVNQHLQGIIIFIQTKLAQWWVYSYLSSVCSYGIGIVIKIHHSNQLYSYYLSIDTCNPRKVYKLNKYQLH